MDTPDSKPQTTHEVQELLLQFISEWQEGARPNLVEYVEKVPDRQRRQTLMSLINADMLQRKELGESPVPSDYLKQFPADASTISLAFNEMFDTQSDRAPTQSNPDHTQLDLSPGQTVGKYEIREVLGIGPIIQFSPSRHQASAKVWATRLNSEAQFETVELD